METALQAARRAIQQANEPVDVRESIAIANDINDRNDQRSTRGALPDGMTIREFAMSGKVIRIRSEVLGCDVVFAADNADPQKAGAAGLPIYWARELRELIGVEPRHLQLIHETKSVFEGEIIP